MGTISVRKLGGLSLIIGPIVAVVCFLIRPGGGLVGGTVDPADAGATIGVLMANSDLAGISYLLGAVGLIMLLYGVNVLVGTLKGGNGEALARYGSLLLLLAAVGWVTSSALDLAIAGGSAGAAAGAVYVISLSINIMAGLLSALAFLGISLGISTRDDSNKVFALIVAAVSAVLVVFAVLSGRDLSLLQTAGLVAGIGYIITVAWSVTLGLGLLKQE